jgi:hypothetical protein
MTIVKFLIKKHRRYKTSFRFRDKSSIENNGNKIQRPIHKEKLYSVVAIEVQNDHNSDSKPEIRCVEEESWTVGRGLVEWRLCLKIYATVKTVDYS